MATPRDTALAFLRKEGLIAPDEVNPDVDAVPFDFTRLTGRQVGAVHSRYAVRHAHAIFVVAKRAALLATLSRDLRLAQAKFRARHKADRKYELDDLMEMDDEISEIRNWIVQVEAEKIVLDAVANGYEDLMKAASREMFRRSSEQIPD